MERRKTTPGLRHVVAAQLRGRVVRWGLGRIALGIVFLVGAISFAFAPDRHEQGSVVWMALLLIMSTFYQATGLRMIERVHRRVAGWWMPATAAWIALSLALAALLMRR